MQVVTATFRFEAGCLHHRIKTNIEGLIKQDDSPEQITSISEQDIQQVENQLNQRPGKRLK